MSEAHRGTPRDDGGMAPTSSIDQLATAATTVRVVAGAEVDWRERKRTPDVVRVADADDIRQLVTTLQVDVPENDDVALMCWPELTFGFSGADRRELFAVSYLHPGWLRCPLWGGDRPLVDRSLLLGWLERHGWTL